MLGVVIVGGSARLAFFPALTAQTLRIAGINPSTPAMEAQMRALGEPGFDPMAIPRFDPATVPVASAAVIDGLFDDTRRAARAGAKIVVWSENAARISAAEEPAFVAAAQAVPIRGTTTLYQRIGDLFGWLCLAGTVVPTAVGLRARRSTS